MRAPTKLQGARLQIVRFVPSEGDDAFAYHAALDAAWSERGALINVEWDMEDTPALVLDLLACPQPLCTYAYLLYEPTTREAEPHYAQSSVWMAEGGHWIARGVEWCEWSGIGFCKVERGVRREGPLARQPWMGVEIAVNEAVRGPWHVHWPEVEHYHR